MLVVGVEVAIPVVKLVSWTTGFVLVFVRITVFLDVFVQGWVWCRLRLSSRSLIPSFNGF